MTRTVRFSSRDDLGERGRAIGLLASTLMPASWGRVAAVPPPASVPPPPAAAPPTVAATAASVTAATSRWAIDARADRFGIGFDLSDLGLSVGVARAFGPGFALRTAFKLERGELPPSAQQPGKVRGIGGQLGLVWTSAGRDRRGHLFWGAEADAIALARSIDLAVDTADSRHNDLILGGDALGLVGFAVSSRAAILVGAGVEVLQEQAADDDRFVTSGRGPPAVRFVTTLGVLARF